MKQSYSMSKSEPLWHQLLQLASSLVDYRFTFSKSWWAMKPEPSLTIKICTAATQFPEQIPLLFMQCVWGCNKSRMHEHFWVAVSTAFPRNSQANLSTADPMMVVAITPPLELTGGTQGDSAPAGISWGNQVTDWPQGTWGLGCWTAQWLEEVVHIQSSLVLMQRLQVQHLACHPLLCVSSPLFLCPSFLSAHSQ